MILRLMSQPGSCEGPWFTTGWYVPVPGGSDLLDLAEAELDRGLPAEDLDEGPDPL